MKSIVTLLISFVLGLTALNAQVVFNKVHYTNGQLAEVWFDMNPDEIQLIRFFPGGQIQEVGNWYRGELHGTWAMWAENGQKVGEAHYLNGHKTGCWKLWNEMGEWQFDLYYDRDQLVEAKACAMFSK